MSIIRTWKWEVSEKEKWMEAIAAFGRTVSQFNGRDFTVVWPTTGPANVRIVAITFDNWASVDVWNDWQESEEGKKVIGALGGTGQVVDRKSYEVLELNGYGTNS